jgi:glycosyltransferase involved in cell wall biosynthesis
MKKITISFCISCKNRSWQIQQTLTHNLTNISKNHEIVLVDFGSTDGLSQWIWTNFSNAIQDEKLIFFRVLQAPPWSSPKAKNLAHRLARGDYLFNLDADNFVTKSDILALEKAASLNLSSQQFAGSFDDGTYGRIGIPRKLFFQLGGYDEALLPMGGQDTDLLNRILLSGNKIGKLPLPSKPAIPNTVQDKIAETKQSTLTAEQAYTRMNKLNLTLSKIKNELYGFQRLNSFSSYRGRLNGKLISIDGFNQIHYLKEKRNLGK